MVETSYTTLLSVLFVVGSHYLATAVLGYLSYLLWRGGDVLSLAAVAVVVLTVLVAIKAVGETLEVTGVIGSTDAA